MKDVALHLLTVGSYVCMHVWLLASTIPFPLLSLLRNSSGLAWRCSQLSFLTRTTLNCFSYMNSGDCMMWVQIRIKYLPTRFFFVKN